MVRRANLEVGGGQVSVQRHEEGVRLIRYKLPYLIGCLLMVLGLFFLQWSISSAKIYFVLCDNHYSWNAPLPECRRPVQLEVAAFASFVLGAACVIARLVGGRRGRSRGASSN
jgi:hypothetical protein